MQIVNGMLFCEDGIFHRMNLIMNGERIECLTTDLDPYTSDIVDAEGCYVVPGFVDIHIHGAMGADFSDGTPEAIETMSRFLIAQGVTSFLGTSMALPEERLEAIYRAARQYIDQIVPGRAVLRGINMEGPFLNLDKRGAQNPEYIVPPDFEMFNRLNEASGYGIRMVTMAPEAEGGLDFIGKASKVCHVSLGHSCAGYDTARQAFDLGADHITHLFNGMSAFHHREPGIVGAAVNSDAYVEVICDGLHIHPAVVKAAFRMFGNNRICLISDAMRACGMQDGQYDLGGQMVTVANGAATIDTGSLAGSITVLPECFRRAVTYGVAMESALKAATINPARSAGLDKEVGSLSRGKRADVLILNPDLSLRHIIFGGQQYDWKS